MAPCAGLGTVAAVTYAEHLRQDHRHRALRAVRPGEHPPLPVRPVRPSEVESKELGAAPGSVLRIETAYEGVVPVVRRLDGSGRVLYDALSEVLGWTPGLALDVTIGPGHWVTFRSAGRLRQPTERRLAHLDRAGRLVIPLGVRTYLGTGSGGDVVLRIEAETGVLRVADSSLLIRALDLLERAEALAAR